MNVAPTNGNNVVIAAGNKVWLSTNALAATVGPPTGVTFTDITRDLPARNVARAIFDPVDPTTIYAVITGFDACDSAQRVPNDDCREYMDEYLAGDGCAVRRDRGRRHDDADDAFRGHRSGRDPFS